MKHFLIVVRNVDHDRESWMDVNRAVDEILGRLTALELRERIIYCSDARVVRISGRDLEEKNIALLLNKLSSHYDVEVHLMETKMQRTWR